MNHLIWEAFTGIFLLNTEEPTLELIFVGAWLGYLKIKYDLLISLCAKLNIENTGR